MLVDILLNNLGHVPREVDDPFQPLVADHSRLVQPYNPDILACQILTLPVITTCPKPLVPLLHPQQSTACPSHH